MMHYWDERWQGPSLGVADVSRIAVFRALHLGDFLCSMPALRALKAHYPGAELTLIGLPWLGPVLDRYPCVDRFLEFPGYRGLEGVLWDPDRTERFLGEAREYGYDLAIQMHGDGRVSNDFVSRLGARASLGYRPEDAEYSQRLDLELSDVDTDHEIDRWLRLVNAVGASGGRNVEFPLVTSDWIEAEELASELGLEEGRRTILVHPGAKDPARRWPPDFFGRAADELARELSAQVLITGTREERAEAYQVASAMRTRTFLAAGKTTLGGLAALLSRALLVLTNDTGPSHLAAAVGAPSVIVFGPTDPRRWAPLDTRAHRALWSRGKPISSISVQGVVEESLALVERCAYLTF